MFAALLALIAIGALAGVIARMVTPGHDRLGCLGTILLGIAGSFVGGFLGWLLFGHDIDRGAVQRAGVFGSIVGAIIVLVLYRRTPGGRRRRRRW